MINIRSGVFETNSSSTHSVTLNFEIDGILETIIPNKDGEIVLEGGDFASTEFSDPYHKGQLPPALGWWLAAHVKDMAAIGSLTLARSDSRLS